MRTASVVRELERRRAIFNVDVKDIVVRFAVQHLFLLARRRIGDHTDLFPGGGVLAPAVHFGDAAVAHDDRRTLGTSGRIEERALATRRARVYLGVGKRLRRDRQTRISCSVQGHGAPEETPPHRPPTFHHVDDSIRNPKFD